MAFQHPQLGRALGWKHNSQQGMQTKNGVLIKWPGPFPTDTQLQQWVDEYLVLPSDDAAKDPKEARRNRFDALGSGLTDLKQFIRDELL